ncbi:MAG: NADH-quinone oxidoreductase subunit C [Bacteroidales bacterium]
MNNKEFTAEIKERFADKITDYQHHNDLRLTFTIQAEALLECVRFFVKEKHFRFIISSGLHSRQGFEIFYHFSNDPSGHVINLHVILPHDQPSVDSLTGLMSSAEWIEREIHELLGIDFKGHPNLLPLLSEGNWPEGTYPYRKDFKS